MLMKNMLAILMGATLFWGCGQAKESQAVTMAAPDQMEAKADVADEAEAPPVPGGGAAAAPPVPIAPVAAPRLLVYHAEMRIKVHSLPKASARLDSLVRSSGGYLNAATETHENGEWHQEITIRVAPGRYASLLAALGRLGEVEQKKQTTDDVTAEHADVAARLRTKRAVEQRYVALLGQARKISEILEVESKIAEVREEIESTESRLKTLNDEVAYSTITLTCYQTMSQNMPDAPIVSLGSRLVEGLYDGWSLLAGLLVGAVTIWPLWLLGAAGMWGIRRWRQRRKAAAAFPVAPLPNPPTGEIR